MRTSRWILGVGPAVLAGLFLVRALATGPDPTLLSFFAVLAVAVGAMVAGSRLGAGVVLLLSLALFQPITEREYSFSLSSIDQPWWRVWAVVSLIALGSSVVASALVLIGRTNRRRIVIGLGAGLTLGVGLIPLFAVLAPQPGFGRALSDAELAELPTIELLNFRYEPPVVSVQADGVYRAKVVNPSDLPHTITVDAIDLEVFVPAGRWSVIEINGAVLESSQLELYCSIDDHRADGMRALLEVE